MTGAAAVASPSRRLINRIHRRLEEEGRSPVGGTDGRLGGTIDAAGVRGCARVSRRCCKSSWPNGSMRRVGCGIAAGGGTSMILCRLRWGRSAQRRGRWSRRKVDEDVDRRWRLAPGVLETFPECRLRAKRELGYGRERRRWNLRRSPERRTCFCPKQSCGAGRRRLCLREPLF